MENPEVPLEQLHEDIHHAAHAHGAHGPEARWTSWIALSTAIIAGMAALASMLAGHAETEAMHAKMSANDTWSWYQADSIKQHGLEDTAAVIAALGHEPDPGTAAKTAKYAAEKQGLMAKAEHFDDESHAFLDVHTRFGYGVTMFQIAIALAAIAALTKRRLYWLVSLGLGSVGVAFAIHGFVLLSAIHPSGEGAGSAHAAETSSGQHAHGS